MRNLALAAVGVVVAGLLVAGGAWLVRSFDTPPGGPAASQPAAAPAPAAPRRAAVPPHAPDAAAEVLPAPVDPARCDRDRDLFGVVADGRGAPVAGADVRALRDPSALDVAVPTAVPREVRAATRTASDGSFVLSLDRGESVRLRVTAPGFAPADVPFCPAGERLRVTLLAAATLEIVATGADGRPAAGAVLRAWTVADRGDAPCLLADATTDAAGSWVLTDVHAGIVAIAATHDALGVAPTVQAVLTEGARVRVVIPFPGGRTVRGRVVDAESGAPVAGATVSEYGTPARTRTTGPDGAFEFPGCPATGFVSFTATAPGFAQAHREAPATGDLELRLQLGDRVVGRIVDAAGAAVAGARLAVYAEGSILGGDWEEIHAAAGADGRFDLGPVRRDLVHALRVEARGHGRTLLEFGRAPADGTIDLGDVVVPEARRVEGVMVDGAGAVVPRAQVLLVGAPADRVRLRPGEPGRVSLPIAFSVRARTDDLGRFRFGDVAPGTYQVEVFENGVMIADVPVAVRPGADATDVVLRLPGAASVRMRVEDAEGRPVAGAGARVHGRGWFRCAVTTSDGTVHFRGLPSEPVRLVATSPGASRARDFVDAEVGPVPPDGREVVVRLHPTAELRGVVRDPDGRPVAGLMLWFEGPAPTNGNWAWTGSDGSFALAAPRGVRVALRTNGARLLPDGVAEATPWRLADEAAVAPATGLVLVVRGSEGGAGVLVRVLDPEGRPVAGCTVRAGAGEFRGRTGDDGTVVATGLPPEDVFVTASADAPGLAPGVLDGTAPVRRGAVTATVRLRAGRSVPGTVRDGRGAALGGARIRVFAGFAAERVVVADAEGRFDVWADAEHGALLVGEAVRPDGIVLRGDASVRGDAAEARLVLAPALH